MEDKYYESIKEYLINNELYKKVKDYSKHLVEGSISVYEYFEESLLHEAMYICGSQGGMPLEEGINELKTRELAQKYNIKIAAYGYSKEVEVAKHLQKIVGKKIMDELTFIPRYERKAFLTDKLGYEVAELYALLSIEMLKKSEDYYHNVSKFNSPFKKAKVYDETINYTEIHQIIDDYINKKCNFIHY